MGHSDEDGARGPQVVGIGDGSFSIGSTVWPGFSKLIEEMGELQQVLGKFIALAGDFEHWDGSDLRLRLHDEMADVKAALWFVEWVNGLDTERIDQRCGQKKSLFMRWHHEQTGRHLGGDA